MPDLNLGSVEQNLTGDRGGRVVLPFTLVIDGVAQVWTGWTARFAIETNPGTTPLLELTEAAGITLGPAAGTGTIRVTDTQMAALPAAVLFYRFVVIDATGQDIPLLHGLFQVRQT
jgi:hypothetical protein